MALGTMMPQKLQSGLRGCDTMIALNQSAAANRRPPGQSDGSDNSSAIVASDRAFPAAVAELGRYEARRDGRSTA